jgi:prevent-host-death family protein
MNGFGGFVKLIRLEVITRQKDKRGLLCSALISLDFNQLVMWIGHMREINASEFKAKCLAILDEVAQTGQPVTILKRGRPIAQLIPPVPRLGRYPQEALVGTVQIHGDIVAPVLPAEVWDIEGHSET